MASWLLQLLRYGFVVLCAALPPVVCLISISRTDWTLSNGLVMLIIFIIWLALRSGAHELAHGWVSNRLGHRVDRIEIGPTKVVVIKLRRRHRRIAGISTFISLLPFGGKTICQDDWSEINPPMHGVWIAAAGPLMDVAWGAVMSGAAWVFGIPMDLALLLVAFGASFALANLLAWWPVEEPQSRHGMKINVSDGALIYRSHLRCKSVKNTDT